MNMMTGFLSFYGVLLLSGAYFGMKAGSRISLIMGIVSGLLTFIGLLIYHNSPQTGRMFLIVLSLALSVVFAKRLISTKKFMPSGMLCVVSLLAVLASFSLS